MHVGLRFAGMAAGAVFAGIAMGWVPAAAQDAPTPQMLALGKQLWTTKASCRNCHGSQANGIPDIPQEPEGANLHTTNLDQAQFAEVVKCGRPGSEMPHFDRLAYTDTRCYGATAADLGDSLPLAGSPTLSDREVNAIVAFVFDSFVGKPVSNFEEAH